MKRRSLASLRPITVARILAGARRFFVEPQPSPRNVVLMKLETSPGTMEAPGSDSIMYVDPPYWPAPEMHVGGVRIPVGPDRIPLLKPGEALTMLPVAIIATNEDRVDAAMEHLRKARDLLKDAGAKKALERVRSALKSADGARRHAGLESIRRARQLADATATDCEPRDGHYSAMASLYGVGALPEGADAVVSAFREGSDEYRVAYADLIVLGMNQEAAGNALDAARKERRYRYSPSTCPSMHWNGGDDYCHDCGENLQGGPDGKEG